MAKKPAKADKSDQPADGKNADETSKKKKNDGFRETVESIVVAFILAFLFRTFEAEAFVIPTGSMAPTLYGRHKDITCEHCGHHFAVGASDELDKATDLISIALNEQEAKDAKVAVGQPNKLVGDVMCPNCRYVTPKDVVRSLPTFKGDRILVNKYPFEFGNPSRWDVVVFKYPEEPQTNYIKRLVGLPGETIEIHQGDVFARPKGEQQFRILRKDDPNKQRELQILVYDNEHVAKKLLEAGWPERWAALKRGGTSKYGWSRDGDGWKQEGRSFDLAATGTRRWLRYRHFVPGNDPGNETWVNVLNGQNISTDAPRMIADFCSYNAYKTSGHEIETGTYWVGDLTVSCEVEVSEPDEDAEFVLELNEGFRFYRARFNLSDGTCTIARSDDNRQLSDPKRNTELITLGTGESRLKGAGKHRVSFANVDDRLTVWVDGRIVSFEMKDESQGNGEYKRYRGDGSYQEPTNADLCPVGIAGRNCGLKVAQLKLYRDIYYRAELIDAKDPRWQNQFNESFGNAGALRQLLDRPGKWWDHFSGKNNLNELLRQRRADGGTVPRMTDGGPVVLEQLADDEFVMLGDNSPRSMDSRLWSNTRKAARRHAVPRHLLVGKAFFIYWPHGVPFLNDGQGFAVRYHRQMDGKKTDIPSFRLPFYPNIRRMHRIR